MSGCPLSHLDRAFGREELRSAVAASLRDLPTGTLHQLAWRWPRRGDPAERIVAEVIDEELLRRPARRPVTNGTASAA